MHIRSVRVSNYRSIDDSGVLTFEPGINLIVGANNVGKSSLLLCMHGRFTGEPHRSITVLPTRDEPVMPISKVEFEVAASGDEVRRLLLGHLHGQQFFPLPSDQAADPQAVLARILTAPEVPFRIIAQAPTSQGPNWGVPEYPATRLYPVYSLPSGQVRSLHFHVNPTEKAFTAFSSLDGAHDSGGTLGQLIVSKIYRFSAERMGLGVGAYGPGTELSGDARNLPEVLSALQPNPARFGEYSELVTQVLPTIQKVAVRPSPAGGSQSEIMIWQFDPTSRRDDLAIPLQQCGTGVGQVLAILYVAIASEQPRTIIIDEPGSFLHPGAARALIGILKEFRQHQYIIATHSPEIISELAGAPVTIVRWGDARSQFEQAKSTTGRTSSSLLNEIGARLSDVFGFDSVLWVEGQSDAQALKSLLEATGRPQRRIAILPIRDTGSFKRRKIAEVMAIYRTLSMGDALLPPAVAFMFDRDGRSDQEIEDARRESEGKVRFLPYRMIENFFLRADLIAQRFNEVGLEHRITTTPEQVADWIRANRRRFYPTTNLPELGSPASLGQIDGASLLEAMFQDLSSARLDYRKTRDTPRLAVLLQQMDPDASQRIIELIADVIEPASSVHEFR
jgi:hypothetical protein